MKKDIEQFKQDSLDKIAVFKGEILKQLDADFKVFLNSLEPEGDPCRVKLGETYWSIDSECNVVDNTEEMTEYDNNLFCCYNYYKTEEEAYTVKNRRLAEAKLIAEINKFTCVPSDGFGYLFQLDSSSDVLCYVSYAKLNSLPKLRNEYDAICIAESFQAELKTFLS
jgi:hypothetical protein